MKSTFFEKKIKTLIGTTKPNIFFIHIPKTGGMSIDSAIASFYKRSSFLVDPAHSLKAAQILYPPGNNSMTDKSKFRQHLVLYEMVKGTKYISGHVHFNLEIWNAYHSQYAYITILRDPIKRYISQYFYDAFKQDEHARVRESLLDFINSPRGKARGHSYINYLSGFSTNDSYDLEEKLKASKENLSKFKLVGFLEKLDSFVENFKQKFGISLKIPHKNKNPISNPEVDEKTMIKIREICEPDLELYEYAKKKFLED